MHELALRALHMSCPDTHPLPTQGRQAAPTAAADAPAPPSKAPMPCAYSDLLELNVRPLLQLQTQPQPPGQPLVLWLEHVYDVSGLPESVKATIDKWKQK